MRNKLWTVLGVVGLLATVFAAGPVGAAPRSDRPVVPAGAATPAPSAPEAALTNATSVTTGEYHSCARLANGQVRCWGSNEEGQLGNGSPTFEFHTAVVTKNVAGTGPLQGVVQVVAGEVHTCARLTTGQVRCFGDNSDGQLGDGTNDDSPLPVVVRNATDTGPLEDVRQISAEEAGTCALLTNGQVQCWGSDSYGELGNGSPLADSNLPVAVQGLGGVGLLTDVRSLGGGYDNNCAVLNSGQARCWGYNGGGSGPSILGNGSNVDSPHPVEVMNPAGSGPLTGVTQISHGGYHGCARLTNGQARCWGLNSDGELGDGTLTERNLPIAVRRVGGGVLTGVVTIFAAFSHTCAVVSGGQVRCWGNDSYGQNGDGTLGAPTSRRLPTPVRNGGNTGNLITVTRMDSRSSHACVRLDSGQLRCWGYGPQGANGNGDTDDEVLPVRVLI